jgi:hypothetical protein
MTTPTVHLNGTSRESLLEGYCDAGRAVNDAIKALQDAAPNDRDYYIQKDKDAFRNAVAEHMDRIERLINVRVELEVLAEAVADQGE